MEYKLINPSDMSEGEISTMVDWQVYEMLKGKVCTFCGLVIKAQAQADSAIYAGKDNDGEMMAAHEHCYNVN